MTSETMPSGVQTPSPSSRTAQARNGGTTPREAGGLSDAMEPLLQEKSRIKRHGRLHWYHWAVVIASLMLTLAAWQFTKQQSEEKTGLRFNREAEQVLALVRERMEKYEDGLWSGVSAIQSAGGEVTYNQWRVFSESLGIAAKYPGINGIGVIHHVSEDDLPRYLAEQRQDRPEYRVHPPHQEGEYWPITYVEPVDQNAAAVGLDMAHETNRYSAARKARDTGEAQITGPIVLVQDAQKTPGFLFYAPYYEGGRYTTIEERREHFVGMVYAPFVFKKLMAGTLEKSNRHVGIQILDDGQSLFNEHTAEEADYDPDPLYKKKIDVAFYGRTWEFDIWSAQSFRAAAADDQPLMILMGGITIDALLLALFLFLTRANRQAVSFAERMTQNFQTKSEELEELVGHLTVSNEDLERFAYVASHDLRAPLRGIDNLAGWIASDLAEVMTEENQEQMDLLRGRVRRLESLLDGLLQYSRIGRIEEAPELVDTHEMVRSVIDLLNFPEAVTVTIEDDLPMIYTARTPLQQTFQNLISNAIKHHDREDAHITISARESRSHVEFSIEDDGPGIPEEFHERIFQMFQTLKRRDEVEGSGMGLALVSKQVRTYGGELTLESKAGRRGAIFRFTWTKQLPHEGAKRAA